MPVSAFDIQKEISQQLKKEIDLAQAYYYRFCNIEAFCTKTLYKELKPLIYNCDNDKWNYYPYPHIGVILMLCHFFKVKSFCDLGAGLGILLDSIKIFYSTKGVPFEVSGFELNKTLIEHVTSLTLRSKIKEQNIFDLTAEQVKDKDVLYFWEPIKGLANCEKFVKKLEKITKKDQYIFHASAGEATGPLLKKSKKFKLLVEGGLSVYIKL